MNDTWAGIEKWMAVNAPAALAALNAGASAEEIARAEAAMSVQFTDDFRASYAIHNGQDPEGPGVLPGGEFLSLDRIVDEWTVWRDLWKSGTFDGIESEPHAGVRNDWYHTAWIPFTYDGGGNHRCLDLDPAPNGRVGQIITMWHDGPEREVLAPSFGDFLESYRQALAGGKYAYSEDDYYAIVAAEDVE